MTLLGGFLKSLPIGVSMLCCEAWDSARRLRLLFITDCCAEVYGYLLVYVVTTDPYEEYFEGL